MKNYLLLVGASMLLSFSCVADELPNAPSEVVSDYVQLCQSYAIEENIEENKLDDYLLSCVNEELTASGYKKVEKLDIE